MNTKLLILVLGLCLLCGCVTNSKLNFSHALPFSTTCPICKTYSYSHQVSDDGKYIKCIKCKRILTRTNWDRLERKLK